MLKIGINGFGRIGRLVLRYAVSLENVEVVAVNDLLDVEQLAYLFKYDSVHGKFKGDVSVDGTFLIVDGKRIRTTSERDPLNLKWDEVGASIIIDASGVFKEADAARAHIQAGAKKVLISAPSKTAPMFVYGVNHEKITPEDTIISSASCTTNCLAPMAKIIHDELGIVEALMTTVHAVTASQAAVDQASRKNYRLGRSSLSNIIPTTTGAAVAVTKVIPELKGKLTGMAFRVPTTDVSVVDLTVRTEKAASYDDIKRIFKEAAEGKYKGIVSYTEDAAVSQDFISDPHLCIFDASAGIALNENFFKLIGWYDNEYAYASKMVDLAVYVSKI
ncbi:MAG TPA: type I glyceraldehyde-3-phosphate dehydrogenase [Flavobacteriaceae bacterium]|nr:type I glyceraldehyde-3-phosphate dehydrogenase [Flavobacteriaceae bacterium]